MNVLAIAEPYTPKMIQMINFTLCVFNLNNIMEGQNCGRGDQIEEFFQHAGHKDKEMKIEKRLPIWGMHPDNGFPVCPCYW